MWRLFGFVAVLILIVSGPILAKALKSRTGPDTTKIIAAVAQVDAYRNRYTPADLQLAIVTASSQTPPNAAAAACWNDIRAIPSTHMPETDKLAYATARIKVFQLHRKKITDNCTRAAPKLIKLLHAAVLAAE